MLLLGKIQKKHPGTSHPRYQTCPLHPTQSTVFTCVWTCARLSVRMLL